MDSYVENAVKDVIYATAPERRVELDALWTEYSPNFNLAHDKPGFNLEAGVYGLVVFTNRTMSYMWLLGHAAQYAFENYCAIPLMSSMVGSFDPTLLKHVSGNQYSKLIQGIQQLAEVENVDDFNWPKQVPKPEAGKPANNSGAMAFDISCMAAAYCFLHEVEHIKISAEGTSLSPHEEESRCDKFARDFLLTGIEKYSSATGYNVQLVTSKRAISIALANFFLLQITPKASRRGSATHPAVTQRIKELTDSLSIPANDHFWIYAGSLLLAHLHSEQFKFEPFDVKSPEDFFHSLAKAL